MCRSDPAVPPSGHILTLLTGPCRDSSTGRLPGFAHLCPPGPGLSEFAGAPGLFPLAPHGFWVLKAGLSVVHGQTLSQAGEEHSMSLRGSGPRKRERESKGLESQEHPPGTNAPWPAGAMPGYSPSLSVEEALEAGREEERGEVVSGTGSEALPAGLLTLSRGLWRW